MAEIENVGKKGFCLMYFLIGLFLFIILVIWVYNYNFAEVPAIN